MKVYKLSLWFKILAWLLLAAFAFKMLSLTSRGKSPTDGRVRHASKLVSLAAAPAPHRHRSEPKPNSQPNEPLELEQLLRANAHRNWTLNEKCAHYPRFEDLHIVNRFYQLSRAGNVTYYLYGAYYDRRMVMDHPSVILLGMVSSLSGPFAPGYCQLWYENSDRPELVEMERREILWYDSWGNGPDHVYPVLCSCSLVGIARAYRVPQLVSLVFEDRCAQPRNALRVIYEAPPRRRDLRFGVCVKDLHYPDTDMSERLVEWLELMRLLGAERVIAYDLGAGTLLPNTRHTLQHYTQRDGLLQLRPFRLLEGNPEPASNFWLSKRLNEVLMYNDCFYRHMYEFDYMAVIDIDEVIMPLGQLRNWTALVERLESNCNGNTNSNSQKETKCVARCSFCFRNVYFSKELPQDESAPSSFYMLRHVRRVADHLDASSAVKCIHSTAYVTTLHNHFPLGWREASGPHDVATSVGQMQHYREPDNKETLKEPPPVRDDNIWRFKDQLIDNVLAVHRELGWVLP